MKYLSPYKSNKLYKVLEGREEEKKGGVVGSLEMFTHIERPLSIGTHAIPHCGTKSSPKNKYPPPPSIVRQ